MSSGDGGEGRVMKRKERDGGEGKGDALPAALMSVIRNLTNFSSFLIFVVW